MKNALLIAEVPKFEPLVVHARQSDGAVDLPTIHFVQLQFFARTEVMETPVNKKIFLSLFLFIVFLNIVFYQLFLLYLPVTEKLLVLFSSKLRSHETRQILDPRKVAKVVVV